MVCVDQVVGCPAKQRRSAQCIPKGSGNSVGGQFHGVCREMGISRRGLYLRVAEQLADHRKTMPGGHGGGCEGVAKVVNAHVPNAGPLADAPPRRLEVGEMGSRILASDDPGIVFNPLYLAEHLQSGRSDMDRLRTSLGIGQVECRALEVDVVPLEGHDFRQSASGEDQQAQGVDGRLALDTLQFALPQNLTEPGKFILGQIALALLLGVLLDMTTGVGAVGAKPPDFGQVERLRQELKAAVGLDRRVAEGVMELGDVRALDLADAQVADPVPDVGLGVVAVADDRAGFAMLGGVLVDDSPAEVVDGEFVPGFLTGTRRIVTVLYAAENLDRFAARFLGRKDAVEAEAHASEFPADAILDEVRAFAAGQNASAEAGDFAVEDDVILVSNFGGLDKAFGDLGHGAGASFAWWYRLTRCDPPIIHGLTMDA